MAYLAFLFICSMWGSNFILMDRATHALGPVDIGFLRLSSGALTVGFYWWLSGRRLRLARADWGWILLICLFCNAMPFVVMPYLIRQGFGHGFFGMMVALVPLVTIVVSIPMLGVWPTTRQMVGVLGGFACIAALLQDGWVRGMPLGLLTLAVNAVKYSRQH